MPIAKETNPLPNQRLTERVRGIGLVVLLVFTLMAVAGYAAFGLHPQLLERAPNLARFYGTAFVFFAQGHVVLTGLALVAMLILRARWRWLYAFAAAYGISLSAELLGTQLGIPFGAYRYTDLLGTAWFGHVPILIPLSWFCMAVPAYVLALRFAPHHRRVRVVAAAALLTIWDLALDPAMSYLTSYWIWEQAGPYYGMPWVNLLGWFGTGVAIALALQRLGADDWGARLGVGWSAIYYGIVLAMPLGMLIAAGLFGAVALTVSSLALWFAGMQWFHRRRAGDRGKAEFEHVHHLDRSEPDQREPNAQPGEQKAKIPAASPLALRFDEHARFVDQHSRSFSFASRLLAPLDRAVVQRLYRFCRTTDDIVDLQPNAPRENVARDLDRWIVTARASFEGGSSRIPWLDELMAESRAAGVPFALVEELAAGVRSDLGAVALQTEAELDQYCYRVASVVGIWLCRLVGVHDPPTLQRAAAMGRAMQLTNILRDVGEDLAQNRVYVPAEWMRRFAVRREDLVAMQSGQPISPEYRRLMDHLIAQARTAYDEAWPGLAQLPAGPARSFAVAAAVYSGILTEVPADRYRNLRRRVYTTLPRKVWLAAGALIRLRRLRRARVPLSRVQRALRPLASAPQRGAAVAVMAMLVGTAAPPPASSAASSARCLPAAAWTDAWSSGSAEASTPDLRLVAAHNRSAQWLVRVRAQYLQAVDQPEIIDEARAVLAPHAGNLPVADAYVAAFSVLEAKHARWPHRKWRYLRSGLAALDALVEVHPAQVEIRYLRLLSCYFLPGVFGRSSSVNEDFDVLSRLLPGARTHFSPELFEQMVRFVMEAGSPSADARASLEASLHALRADGPPAGAP